MDPNDIFIRNTSSLFQYEKMAREVDACDDIETLQQMCKFLIKMEMKTSETYSIILQDTMTEVSNDRSRED